MAGGAACLVSERQKWRTVAIAVVGTHLALSLAYLLGRFGVICGAGNLMRWFALLLMLSLAFTPGKFLSGLALIWKKV
ncbi:hypothetical protein [Shewanella dokdonensis]|uniref:Uncharacterized protein n=1 Tax=Shewanella dokdonensis TaxID=712036 RepID=A0ABX8DHE0_9GAMM|nr:hypothetical protein [Shewanella dokdonensis]MCL1073828.1 hypothetical protein [Shewanella dokdonensis]QVK23616.1 hypothetical protein KHX94_02465 [Shewanella dokdonensis]